MNTLLTPLLIAALVAVLSACGRPDSAREPLGAAQLSFDELVERCRQSIDAREPQVRQTSGGEWIKEGFSAALVQGEVQATDSAVTPYVGKIVVKDNLALATAPTQTEAAAVMLSPVHLVANRTHTLVLSFDGQTWRWNNGSLATKMPLRDNATAPLTPAGLSAAEPGFAACLPR